MAADANLTLQASVTKTSTFNGTGINLGTTMTPRGLYARVIYSAAANASGANAFTFSVDHSANDSTYYAHTSGAKDVVTLTTAAQAGEIFIPIKTDLKYIRLTVTQVGSGGSPTITYYADICSAKP